MRKTIKLIAALVIIGTSFTSCTQEETPTPQTQLEDFEGTYGWVNAPHVTFTLTATTRTTFEGIEVVELESSTGAKYTDLKRVDADSFIGLYKIHKASDNVLFFMDPTGVAKLSIDLTQTGETLRAVRVQ